MRMEFGKKLYMSDGKRKKVKQSKLDFYKKFTLLVFYYNKLHSNDNIHRKFLFRA